VRELKNIAEQISVLAQDKSVGADELRRFLPEQNTQRLPMLMNGKSGNGAQEFMNERDILYKLFFDMKKDVTELKRMFIDVLQNPAAASGLMAQESFLRDTHAENAVLEPISVKPIAQGPNQPLYFPDDHIQEHVEVDDSLNIMDMEKELIEKALKKHKGKRKDAASDLGISERTLYRKLKEYNIEE
jgi:DNA-binding NtrC family response regulator